MIQNGFGPRQLNAGGIGRVSEQKNRHYSDIEPHSKIIGPVDVAEVAYVCPHSEGWVKYEDKAYELQSAD